MSGNPVRIRDGYATVTGYKLPMPLISRSGRRERGQAPSQDTGLVVLVRSRSRDHFSVKEKDEASPIHVCGKGFVLDAFILPICRSLKVFLFVALIAER